MGILCFQFFKFSFLHLPLFLLVGLPPILPCFTVYFSLLLLFLCFFIIVFISYHALFHEGLHDDSDQRFSQIRVTAALGTKDRISWLSKHGTGVSQKCSRFLM